VKGAGCRGKMMYGVGRVENGTRIEMRRWSETGSRLQEIRLEASEESEESEESVHGNSR
jgi:hypothetical protein